MKFDEAEEIVMGYAQVRNPVFWMGFLGGLLFVVLLLALVGCGFRPEKPPQPKEIDLGQAMESGGTIIIHPSIYDRSCRLT